MTTDNQIAGPEQLLCFYLTPTSTLFMTNLSHKLCANEVNLVRSSTQMSSKGARENFPQLPWQFLFRLCLNLPHKIFLAAG